MVKFGFYIDSLLTYQMLRGSMRGTLVSLLCSLFLTSTSVAQTPSARAIPVLVTKVTKQPLVDRIEALGTLRSNESVNLTATVTNTLSAIHFEDGQRVEKGFLLAEMTSTEESALLSEARAEVNEAQLQLDRLVPLIERGAVPKSTVDERKRNLSTAQARVQAIRSRLQDLLIVAPFDGVVGLRGISTGALVTPGSLIATIDDDSIMKLDFSVPSTFLTVLRPGLKVLAKARAFRDEAFNGEVSSVDTRIDPVTRAVAVRALIPNPDRRLKPGLLMTVELFKDPRESAVIPEDAIVSIGREHSVFVADVQDSTQAAGVTTAKRKVVKLGAREPGRVEITEGLSPGELVIVHGTMMLRPGSSINILKELGPTDSIKEVLRDLPQERN